MAGALNESTQPGRYSRGRKFEDGNLGKFRIPEWKRVIMMRTRGYERGKENTVSQDQFILYEYSIDSLRQSAYRYSLVIQFECQEE